MAETLLFELVSPAKLVISQPVEMVVVPGAEGDFGALPQHAPLISAVRPGVIDIYEGGKVINRIFVAGGVAEVTGDRCTVLAEEALPVAELDSGKIATRAAEAEKALAAADNDFARDQAKLALAVAQAMLQVLQEKPAAH
ncbi:MAG TPA: ATP synthase F1 subunit epsilon [Magnetospirillaceae bacterium]|jgi:F-type H+-transporting ATPase subunit epsilon